MIDALGIRGDEDRLAQLVAKQTMDMVPGELRRMLTKEELVAVIDNPGRAHPAENDCRTHEG